MTERDLTNMLAKRYSAPEWAFLPQVRNGTSFRRKTVRTADALAQSLWASRGLELHGFEIKVSRQDWKKELSSPEKSEDIQRFCDRWWIVVSDKGIVQPGELPPTWGLMHASGKGLSVAVEAPKLKSEPLDRLMFCAIARRLTELSIPRDSIKDEIEQAANAAEKRGRECAEFSIKELRKSVQAFEAASGMPLGYCWEAKRIGEAVKFVMENDMDGFRRRITELKMQAARIAKEVVKEIEEIEAQIG